MNLPLTVRNVYYGSDGASTQALYERLGALGPAGEVAVNLFRASKNSERAKVYRGGIPGRGSYRRMAYDRKGWALENLTTILAKHAAACGLTYGWQHDPATPGYEWVLYVDLPTGTQVSFHAPGRGDGPDYPGTWDGQCGASAERIIGWCGQLLAGAEVLA